MKVFLLHADHDLEVKPELRGEIFDAMLTGSPFAVTNARRNLERQKKTDALALPEHEDALTRDLELDTLWRAMAAGDEFLLETVKRVVLSSLREPGEILYRQHVLADCLAERDIVRGLYDLAIEALGSERAVGSLWRNASPDSTLHRSVQLLSLYLDALKKLRKVADEQAEGFRSEGFTRFFAMVRDELADEYLATVEAHLRDLEFKHGLLQTVELAKGDKGANYIVRRLREQRWTERLPWRERGTSYGFTIPSRDENGFKALEELRSRGLNEVANVVGQSADHVKSFFAMLRIELGFYLGCLNLSEQLEERGEPTCVPEPTATTEAALTARGLYDVCLAFHVDGRVVGNDIDATGKPLVMVTGANQGGKSTFLRSLGLAQLMMQAGMFVGAESFTADVRAGVFTHYKREEDVTMEGGKLDEELRRMSDIADEIAPGSLLLCNESFAATNESEGSEIARQVIRAMLDKDVRVVFVTHMYDLAHSFEGRETDTVLFLRPERGPDGERTFKVREGAPQTTSYGQDSYQRIFGTPGPSPGKQRLVAAPEPAEAGR